MAPRSKRRDRVGLRGRSFSEGGASAASSRQASSPSLDPPLHEHSTSSDHPTPLEPAFSLTWLRPRLPSLLLLVLLLGLLLALLASEDPLAGNLGEILRIENLAGASLEKGRDVAGRNQAGLDPPEGDSPARSSHSSHSSHSSYPSPAEESEEQRLAGGLGLADGDEEGADLSADPPEVFRLEGLDDSFKAPPPELPPPQPPPNRPVKPLRSFLSALWTQIPSLRPKKAASPPAQSELAQSELERLLEHHVALPGRQTCGSWVSRYARLHRDMRSGRREPKYLTYAPIPGAGFGDRINGIVAGFLTALLTDRAFILADSGIASAFDPAHVDWHVREDVPLTVTTTKMTGIPQGAVLRIVAPNLVPVDWPRCPRCLGMAWDIVPNFEGLGPAANVILHSQHGIVTQIFSHRDSLTFRALHALGLRLKTTLGCVLRFLMRPNKAVLRLAMRPLSQLKILPPRANEEENEAPGSGANDTSSAGAGKPASEGRLPCQGGGARLPCKEDGARHPCHERGARLPCPENGERLLRKSVCIHARTHDAVAWAKLNERKESVGPLLERAKELVHTLEQCAQDVEDFFLPREANATWFLMSDSLATKDMLSRNASAKVVTSGVKPKHVKLVGSASFLSTAVDWILFSMCDYYVIIESGLSKTAYAYNLNSPPLFMFSRMEQGKAKGACDPVHSLDLFNLMGWSGL